jgi:L-alanine-DL-glutamate epimerase-like enolase superfamily enzyme
VPDRREEFRRFLELDALDYVQPDATHVGGIAVCRRVAAMAEERGAGLIVHTGAAIGPGFMANLHVAFASPVAVRDGLVSAPTEPGLGVTLDAAAIERYPYREGNEEFA